MHTWTEWWWEVRIFIRDFSTRKATLRMLNTNSFKHYFFGQIRLMRKRRGQKERRGRMKGGGEGVGGKVGGYFREEK